MSFRPLLWLGLSAAAVPFLLETTTGCSLIVGEDDPDPNAYVCECSCPAGDALMASVQVAAGADDAEETGGSVDIGDGNLDLGAGTFVGLRFDGLGIPPGASITTAYVQFTADEDGDDDAELVIRIQDAADPPSFSETAGDISGRSTVSGASVGWEPPQWFDDDADEAQRTPNLAALLQKAVDRPDWNETGAVVLVFEGVSGERLAESLEDGDGEQPVLHVDYGVSIATQLPVCEVAEGDAGDLERMKIDCAGRVESTFAELAGSCAIVPNAEQCSCSLLDLDPEPDEEKYAFEHDSCEDPCPSVMLDSRCDNFDPAGFDECLRNELETCANQDPVPDPCVLSEECLTHVSATQTSMDLPVCVAEAGPGDIQSVAMHLFGRQSVCEVSGTSEILVGDGQEEPKKDPATRGRLAILGGPCPGDTCPAGFSSRLVMDPISFDVKFHRDPVFEDLFQAGGVQPGSALVGGSTAGLVPEGAALAVSSGRRGSDERAVTSQNDMPLALTVNWAARQCRLEGNLAGEVDAEGLEGLCSGDGATPCTSEDDCASAGGTCELPSDPEPLVVNVDLFGQLVNTPPTARAGDSRTVECTSPEGASVVLDGSGSSDPDDAPGLFPDIRLASWRVGDRFGEELGSDLQVSTSLGTGESQTYRLLVMDSFAQTDVDTTTISVIDTTPPQVFCNAVATITPDQVPDKNETDKPPVAFTGTATDLCDADVTPEILAYDCYAIKKNGRRVDKTRSCQVELSGDTLTVLDPGGIGDHIAWTLTATDASGNSRTLDCEVEVVKK